MNDAGTGYTVETDRQTDDGGLVAGIQSQYLNYFGFLLHQ